MRRGEEAVEGMRAGKTSRSNKSNSGGGRHLLASCSICQDDEEAEDDESESVSVTGTASTRI